MALSHIIQTSKHFYSCFCCVRVVLPKLFYWLCYVLIIFIIYCVHFQCGHFDNCERLINNGLICSLQCLLHFDDWILVVAHARFCFQNFGVLRNNPFWYLTVTVVLLHPNQTKVNHPHCVEKTFPFRAESFHLKNKGKHWK